MSVYVGVREGEREYSHLKRHVICLLPKPSLTKNEFQMIYSALALLPLTGNLKLPRPRPD